MNVFAYGTLQFPEVIETLLNDSFAFEDLAVEGFRRRLLANEAFPVVVRDESESVNGRLYFGIPQEDKQRLDDFESDYYKPIQIEIESKSAGKVEAVIYVLRDEFLNQLSDREWDKNQFANEYLANFLIQIKSELA